MLLGAREHATERCPDNVTFAAANSEALPFPHETFDRLTCRFGAMFFPNIERAMEAARRVLRPNGRAVFLAWGEARHNTFFTATTGVLLKHAPPAQQTPDLAHRFAQPGSLSAALGQGAFRQITETYHSISWPWLGTPEGFWDYSVEVRRSFRKIFESLTRPRGSGRSRNRWRRCSALTTAARVTALTVPPVCWLFQVSLCPLPASSSVPA
jgi:SAM-dependent methyltransferase